MMHETHLELKRALSAHLREVGAYSRGASRGGLMLQAGRLESLANDLQAIGCILDTINDRLRDSSVGVKPVHFDAIIEAGRRNGDNRGRS